MSHKRSVIGKEHISEKITVGHNIPVENCTTVMYLGILKSIVVSGVKSNTIPQTILSYNQPIRSTTSGTKVVGLSPDYQETTCE